MDDISAQRGVEVGVGVGVRVGVGVVCPWYLRLLPSASRFVTERHLIRVRARARARVRARV